MGPFVINLKNLSKLRPETLEILKNLDFRVFVNPLTPVPPVTARDEPWRALAFLPLLTSSLLTKIGIIHTQILQEGKIFPMMPRSE